MVRSAFQKLYREVQELLFTEAPASAAKQIESKSNCVPSSKVMLGQIIRIMVSQIFQSWYQIFKQSTPVPTGLVVSMLEELLTWASKVIRQLRLMVDMADLPTTGLL
jgi:hypothetical protein